MPLTKDDIQQLKRLKDANKASGNGPNKHRACKAIRSKYRGGKSLQEIQSEVVLSDAGTIKTHLTGRCNCEHDVTPLESRIVNFQGGKLIVVTCPECPAKYNHYSSLTDHINTEHNA